MLLTPQEVNQKMLNLLVKLTQWLFLVRQYASAAGSVCRPLCVNADGFPVWTDNVFLQSYSSAYRHGFQNLLH